MDPAVFGYIRVSQAEGESELAIQRRILNDHGLRDDRLYTDVASGRIMRRPAWKQLRETLQPGDVVVVPRIDRLARNLTEGLRTIEELQAVRDFLDNGDSVSAAARAFGVSGPTVRAVKDGTYPDQNGSAF